MLGLLDPTLLNPLDAFSRAQNATSGFVSALGLLDGATPHEIVWSQGSVRLRYYAPKVPNPQATPLLLVTPLINRYRVCDLRPGGSLVASMVNRGIPVYLVDWGAPTRADSHMDFSACVRVLRRCVRHIGAPQVDLTGYCLGGCLSVMFAAVYPELVRKLATINAPIEFACDLPHMDLLKLWVERDHFPVERLTQAFGNMPGALINSGFQWQVPTATAGKSKKAWEKFDKDGFADLWMVLESWNSDNIDVFGAAYRQIINDLYRHNRLARSELTICGKHARLENIQCPVFVFAAKGDTTAPPRSAQALLDLVGSDDTTYVEERGGHLISVVGNKAEQTMHAPLADWLLQ